jgi:phospholipid/cholesterol/gamma-HCH transport system permease protein
LLRSTRKRILIIFPAKLLLIGLVLALSACSTGLSAREGDTPSSLLARGCTRGVTGIVAVTLLLSAVV